MSLRDDFTKKTIDTLAKRAGGRCSICNCATYGPNDNPYVATNIGQAAHIAAAAEGGPRYDPAMSPEVRKSLKNALWLCSNCHDNIDRNPESYPVKRLLQIKKEAENNAKESLGVPSGRQPTENSASIIVTTSSIAIVEVRKLRATLANHHGSKISDNVTWDTLSRLDFIDFNRNEYLQEVGQEVMTLLFHLAGHKHSADVYLEIVRHVKDIVDSFIAVWGGEDIKRTCELIKMVMDTTQSVRSSVYQSALALLKDMAKMGKTLKNKSISDTIDGYFQGVVKTTRVKRMYHEKEETDYHEGPPPAKRECSTGNEDQAVLQYLDKMLELSESTTPTSTEDDIIDLGFEPNII